uniref:Uncharacterized protein n=1 Tax=Photinus pyralis TaxID=7054 RepID=A0A1Y1K0Q8_PHOPY
MAKIALWAFLLLALEASCAVTPTGYHGNLEHRLKRVRDGALKAVETLSLDNVEKRRAIVSHASEFAYGLEKTINKLFQNFVRVSERDSDRNLPQLALRLNNIVHQVQDALITRPTQLKEVLRDNIHQVYVIGERFRQILQHLDENGDFGEMKEDIKEIVETLIDALYKLQIQHRRTREEVRLGKRITDALDKITWRDRATLDQLVTAGAVFGDFLNRFIEHLRKEFPHFAGYDRKAFEEVCTELDGIRARLSGVLDKLPMGEIKKKVEDMIGHVRVTVTDFDGQLQKLEAMGQVSEDDPLNAALINGVKNVRADCVHAEERMLSRLEEIVERPMK